MARYTIRWVTYAEQQRDTLPSESRHDLEALLNRLINDPRRQGTYDKRTELWRTVFGYGLLTYSIEDRWVTITVLRATWIG
ncbi:MULTISPECIES: hypothetical protein [Protofrankia]|uniref:Plasmid stabilization system n=1 Tax=Candidatus Protofrankia datiscae TaxID=2716812 RepID=F8AUT5_9ACTN|nr:MULTISPECIES: hypothetical protein [Protofrankia]AEH08129.1 hypothetical protein FsymDg_0602 [Candidatus Protofrankia datiscae]